MILINFLKIVIKFKRFLLFSKVDLFLCLERKSLAYHFDFVRRSSDEVEEVFPSLTPCYSWSKHRFLLGFLWFLSLAYWPSWAFLLSISMFFQSVFMFSHAFSDQPIQVLSKSDSVRAKVWLQQAKADYKSVTGNTQEASEKFLEQKGNLNTSRLFSIKEGLKSAVKGCEGPVLGNRSHEPARDSECDIVSF